jgi:hypothetical protein
MGKALSYWEILDRRPATLDAYRRQQVALWRAGALRRTTPGGWHGGRDVQQDVTGEFVAGHTWTFEQSVLLDVDGRAVLKLRVYAWGKSRPEPGDEWRSCDERVPSVRVTHASVTLCCMISARSSDVLARWRVRSLREALVGAGEIDLAGPVRQALEQAFSVDQARCLFRIVPGGYVPMASAFPGWDSLSWLGLDSGDYVEVSRDGERLHVRRVSLSLGCVSSQHAGPDERTATLADLDLWLFRDVQAEALAEARVGIRAASGG